MFKILGGIEMIVLLLVILLWLIKEKLWQEKDMNKLNDREKLIYDFMKDNNISIEEIIDVVVKSNRLVGVGLVSLKDYVEQSIDKHHDKTESLDKIMNG